MFQTDFNHWLQGWDWTFWISFMKFISFFGNTYPVMLICLIIISMVHLRKGWILLNIVAMTAIFTNWMKETIDYPRPIAVDINLSSFGEEKTDVDLTYLQPTSFFQVFDEEVLQLTRKSEVGRLGFPSGHTSIMVAICLGFAALFHSRKAWAMGMIVVVLTMISRLYLGVHYLGDVIGGLMLGSLLLFVLYMTSHSFLDLNKRSQLLIFGLLPLLPMIFLERFENWQSSLILGTNLGLILNWNKSYFHLSASLHRRIFNFLSLSIIFLGSFILVKISASNQANQVESVLIAITAFTSIYLHFQLAKKMRWIEANPDQV